MDDFIRLCFYSLACPLNVLSSLCEQRRKLPKKKIADCTSEAIPTVHSTKTIQTRTLCLNENRFLTLRCTVSISRFFANVGIQLNTFRLMYFSCLSPMLRLFVSGFHVSLRLCLQSFSAVWLNIRCVHDFEICSIKKSLLALTKISFSTNKNLLLNEEKSDAPCFFNSC